MPRADGLVQLYRQQGQCEARQHSLQSPDAKPSRALRGSRPTREQRKGSKNAICGARATSSKAAAGPEVADRFVAAACGAEPPPARAGLRQERALSLVLKVAAASAPHPGLAPARRLKCSRTADLSRARIWAGGSVGGAQVPPPVRFAPHHPPTARSSPAVLRGPRTGD